MTALTPRQRRRFDELLAAEIDALPPALADLLEQVPLVVDDEPTAEILDDLGIDPGSPDGEAARDELCGLHTGLERTQRSVDDAATLPSQINLFRRGIIHHAGGWRQPDADQIVAEEIRITILHEIGHEFGLDEDDLEELGYA